MKNKKAKDVVKYLTTSKKKIIQYLNKVVAGRDFNYRTFGTAIEEHLIDITIELLKTGGFIDSDKDYIIAPDKNYFPDFELKLKNPLALEFKSGNTSQFRKGIWVEVLNSENDMGTINKWPSKIDKFGGENIYYMFVTYNFNDKMKKILDIEIDPFYKFIGLNSSGLLKYREKDGNLRPKNFGKKPPITSFKQFNQLFLKTEHYRSKRIIKKHQLILKRISKKIKEV